MELNALLAVDVAEGPAAPLGDERRLEAVAGLAAPVERAGEVREEVWLLRLAAASSAGGTGIERSARAGEVGALLRLGVRERAPLGSVIGTEALLAVERTGRW